MTCPLTPFLSTLLLIACVKTGTATPDPLTRLGPAETQELVDQCLRHAQLPTELAETLRAELEFIGFAAERPRTSCGLRLVPPGSGARHRLQLELVPVSARERTAILRVMHPLGGPTEHKYRLALEGKRWDTLGPPEIVDYL